MIPNLKSEVERAKADYPLAWKHAHTDSLQTEDFIRILAARLHRIDPNFGLNGKRGNPRDISDDVVNYMGEGVGYDPITGRPVTVIDVIASAGSPAASPAWALLNDPTNPDHTGPGAWVSPVAGSAPAPLPTVPYPGDAYFVNAIGAPLEADYKTANQTLDAGSATWFARTIWRVVNEGMTPEQSVAKSQVEWRQALDPKGLIWK